MLKTEYQQNSSHSQTCRPGDEEHQTSSQNYRQVIDEIAEISSHSFSTIRPNQTIESLVGECLDTSHPTLTGRVLVLWNDANGKEQKQWLPTLLNLPVRKKDRLLLTKPGNWNEMIVTGVIDGFAKRPEIDRKTSGKILLEQDEAIRVTSRNGQELLELLQTDAGPVIRVLCQDTAVELPGKLKLTADSIELEAGAGSINIKATDDVCINGEMIHLN